MVIPSKIIYEFGSFLLNAAEHQLLRDGQPVPLKPKVFDLLLLFIENDGCLLPKDVLMKELWPESFVEEHNLAVCVFSLRKALGEEANGNGSGNSYIETVPRVGYRFTANVRKTNAKNGNQLFDQDKLELVSHQRYREEVAEQSLPAINPTKVVEAGSSNREAMAPKHKSGSWRKILGMALLSVILLCAGSISLSYLVSSRESSFRPPIPKVKAIAILPFQTLNPGVDEHLGVGMADALITALGNSGEAIVRPMSAVLKYHNGERDLFAIGNDLSVDAVLDGKIQREGNKLRVTVQLVDTQSGETLLADKFDQDSTDIFLMQDSISRLVLSKLTLKLADKSKDPLAKRPTNNPEAYEAYLKGLFFRNLHTTKGFSKSLAYYEQAIELDPEYAEAYVGVAECNLALWGRTALLASEAFPKAEKATLKALALDGSLAEAHAVFGHLQFLTWDFDAAEREFKLALDLNPNLARTHQQLAVYLRSLRRYGESLAELRKAQEIDPHSLAIATSIGTTLYMSRQSELAIAQLKSVLERDANFNLAHFTLGLAYAERGMYEAAVSEFQLIMKLEGHDAELLSCLAHAYALAGKKDKARVILGELKSPPKQTPVEPYFVAVIYVGLKENDQAFAWLEKSFEQHDPNLPAMKCDPQLDPLRSDPRFSSLLKRVGFEG